MCEREERGMGRKIESKHKRETDRKGEREREPEQRHRGIHGRSIIYSQEQSLTT